MSEIVNPLAHSVEARGWECASHEVYAAPGYQIFLRGLHNGRRQEIAIDPDEIDELTKRLHAAKRYARRPKGAT